MSSIVHTIKLVAQAKDAIAQIREYRDEIVGTAQTVKRYEAALSGDKILKSAHDWTAAVSKLGGATSDLVTKEQVLAGASKLTAAEKARLNTTLTEAIAKYRALGETAPRAMVELEKATRAASTHALSLNGILRTAIGTFAGFLSAQAVMTSVSSGFRDLGSAVFGMNSTLETAELQFATLMGSSDRARAHVKDLFEIAKKTPFETGPIIEASRMLQVMGGNALNTKENIIRLGDTAAATSAPIDELSTWVGRLYASLQSGKPFGEAAENLRRLGVWSPEIAAKMEEVAKSGLSAQEKFKVFTDYLDTNFKGSMQRMAGTWSGVMSTMKDSLRMFAAETFRPVFELMRDSVGLLNEALGSEGVQGALDGVAQAVQNAFGGDRVTRVRAFAGVLLSVGTAAINVADFVYRAWNVVALFVNTILTGIAQLVGVAFNLVDKLASAVASLPGQSGFKAQAAQIHDLALQAAGAAHSLERDTEASWKAVKGTDAAGASFQGMRQAIAAARAELAHYSPAVSEISETYGPMTKAQADAAAGAAKLGRAQRSASDGTKEAAKQAKAAAESLEKLRQSLTGMDAAETVVEQLRAMGGSEGLWQMSDDALSSFIGTLEQAIAAEERLGNVGMAAALKEVQAAALIEQSFRGASSDVDRLAESLKKAGIGSGTIDLLPSTSINTSGFQAPSVSGTGTGSPRASASAWSNWSGIGGQISTTILSAATGGGSIVKSVGSLLGGNLGTSLVSKFGETITGALGKTFGGALNAVLPGIGSLIGSGVGALVGKIGSWLGIGHSKGYYEDKQANQSLDQLRSQLLATYGSLEDIAKAGGDAGKELVAAWGDASKKGLEHFQTLLDDFNESLAESKERLEAIQQTGSLLDADSAAYLSTLSDEEIASFVSGQAESGIAAIKKITSGSGASGLATLSKTLADAKASGSSRDVAKAQTEYDAYLKAHPVSASEASGMGGGVAGIAAQIIESGGTMTDVIDQLGPYVQSLREQFTALGVDGGAAFNALAGSIAYASDEAVAPLLEKAQGAGDLMTSLFNMGRLNDSTFQGLAASVLATRDQLVAMGKGGDEMAAALKPQLQKIWEIQQRTGWAVDATTQAMIDEAVASGQIGAAFQSPADQMLGSIDKLCTRMEEFIDTILGVPKAVEKIPDNIEIDAEVRYHATKGGSVDEGENDETPGFATGTQGRYLDFGAGTLVTLHGRERVMTEGEGRSGGGSSSGSSNSGELAAAVNAMAAALARQRPVAVALTMEAGTVSDQELVEERLFPAIVRAINDDAYGAASDLVRVLKPRLGLS